MTPCKDHDVEGCILCTVDAYWQWLDARRDRREQVRRERRALTVEERFDLGGEG
jgi:endo-alpha-1,4-polygalactosaminidase (GH114 family)